MSKKYIYTMKSEYQDNTLITIELNTLASGRAKFCSEQIELLLTREIARKSFEIKNDKLQLEKSWKYKLKLKKIMKKIDSLNNHKFILECPLEVRDFLKSSHFFKIDQQLFDIRINN